jgi:hypothetical protein
MNSVAQFIRSVPVSSVPVLPGSTEIDHRVDFV